MKIKVLFGQRKESYPGEYGPEVLFAWDEFCVDQNPEGFADALEKTRAEYAPDMAAMRLLDVEVDQDRIRRLLLATPMVSGTVRELEERVAIAKAEIEREDRETARRAALREITDAPILAETARRARLPPEDPDHICGMMCDGQDGQNSHCARLRRKLGYA